MISGVYQPLLGLLAATGMIKGFNELFISFGWITESSGTYQLLKATGDCLFYFFPIFLGYTAMKKFGGSPFIGMAIGASLVYPTLSGLSNGESLFVLYGGTIFESPIHITFLGIPVILMSYSSSVIPIILASFCASRFEKVLKRIIPRVVRTFLVPFFIMLIIVPVTFLIIGPISTWAGNLIGSGATEIYGLSPILTGFIIGFMWQVLVIFGLHWGIIPIALLNIGILGSDPIMALSFAASFAQIGAVLAVIIKTKNKKMKVLGIPAFISGIFGVTEPAIYGLTLPLKRPFIMSCIAGGIGGSLLGYAGSKFYILGGLGVFGYPNYVNKIAGIDFTFYMSFIATGVAFIFGFILTYLVGFKDPVEETSSPITEENENLTEEHQFDDQVFEIASPLTGTVIKLQEIKDETFAGEHMGKGVAIRPTSGRVVSPVNGIVQIIYRTKHAIGLISDDGVELLIHIGQDTVQLKGQYFEAFVKDGDRVQVGDLIVEFDLQAIQEAGYETVTPIIITNTSNYQDIAQSTNDIVNEKEPLLKVFAQN